MDKSKQSVTVYDKIAEKYVELYYDDKGDLPFIDDFLAKLSDKDQILEVGCGAGQFTKYMMGKGFEVEGIDLSRKMLSLARKKVPDGKFKYMDMRKLDYKDEEFDGILSAYALIHIPSEEVVSTLKESKRVLKKSGIILVIVQKGGADKFIDEPLRPEEKVFVNLFSKKRLRNYLEKAGFKIVYEKLREGKPETDSECDLGDEYLYMIGEK